MRLLRFSRGAGVDIRDLTRVGYLPFRLNVFLCAAILLTCPLLPNGGRSHPVTRQRKIYPSGVVRPFARC